MYLDVVQLGLQVHLALLGDVTRRDGNIAQHTGVVIDGAQSDFQIVVDVALGNNALRADPQLLQVVRVAALAERRQLEHVGIREELVALLAVEVAYLAHQLVRVQQPPVRRIERQPDNRVLVYQLVPVGQLAFLFLLPYQVRLVLHRTDDAAYPSGTGHVLGHADVIDVPPARRPAGIVKVPTVAELGTLQSVVENLPEPVQGLLHVVRVHVLHPLLQAQSLVGCQVSVELMDIALGHVVAHHLVGTYLQRLQHHVRRLLRLARTLPHTTQYHAVRYQYDDKYGKYHQ